MRLLQSLSFRLALVYAGLLVAVWWILRRLSRTPLGGEGAAPLGAGASADAKESA